MKLTNNCFVDKLLLIDSTCVNQIVCRTVNYSGLYIYIIEKIIFISRESITQHMLKLRLHRFVSFTYIVIYPENEKYLKKYLKYLSKVFVFKYICI